MLSLSLKEEKSEEEKPPNSLETKFNKVLSDLIGKCEKAENASFDVVAVKAALVNAQKLVNTLLINNKLSQDPSRKVGVLFLPKFSDPF
jgi:hypothetical protein